MWNKINSLRRIFRISLIKTLFINFYKLPFRQAIKLPIIVGRNTYFYDLSGKIRIHGDVTRGLIRFGYFGEDTQVWSNDKSLLKINGNLIFNGQARFGIGVSIRVEKNANLTFGKDCMISNNVKIICYKAISIGEHARIAWETQIIDTTFHFIKNILDNTVSELNKEITIGKNNWIGNRTSIMKGAITPDFCIIASGSLVNKDLKLSNNCIVAGTPVKLIKENVQRVLMKEELEIKKKLNIN